MSKEGFTPCMELGFLKMRARNQYVREAIGEFFGTMILMFMLVGAEAQFHLTTKAPDAKNPFESQLVPIFGIVFGILIAIQTTGGVSGAHINPSVSIGLAVAGLLSWYSVPGYVAGQFLGAYIGSLLAWSLIHPTMEDAFLPNTTNMTLQEYDVAFDKEIAGIFGPLRKGVTLFNGFSTEFMLTALLLIVICGACDKRNSFQPPKYLLTLFFPLIIAGMCFSHDKPTGTLLNPARDLGPRLAAWTLGWDTDYVFKNYDWKGNQQHWWIVGLFGPTVGCVVGALIYSFLIGPQNNIEHLEKEESKLEIPLSPYATQKNPKEMGERDTDWRSTVFLPKPQTIPTQNGGTNSPNQNNNNNRPQSNNNSNNMINHRHHNGYANQGYQ